MPITYQISTEKIQFFLIDHLEHNLNTTQLCMERRARYQDIGKSGGKQKNSNIIFFKIQIDCIICFICIGERRRLPLDQFLKKRIDFGSKL